jgi:hypothetical protein
MMMKLENGFHYVDEAASGVNAASLDYQEKIVRDLVD